MDDPQSWLALVGALVTLVGTITASVLVVIRELRKGQAVKAEAQKNPEVPGSGAAICERLDAVARSQEATAASQARFNALLALHLGMGEPRTDSEPEAAANGR